MRPSATSPWSRPRRAKTVVPDVREVSASLMEDQQDPETVVFTGSLAHRLDERQYEAGFGPCMDAATADTTTPVANADPETPTARSPAPR